MSNMDIWNNNRKIEERYTKRAKLNGQMITSFSLQAVMEMATKQFGPIGKGWGYDIIDERNDAGAVIQNQVTHENGDSQEEVREIVHTLLIQLWYTSDGEKYTVPTQAGETIKMMRTKYGPSFDAAYFKKSLADAIKKSLSMLGFGADIFLGLMDDNEYMQVMHEERELVESSKLPGKIQDFGQEVQVWCKMMSANNVSHSLTAMLKSYTQQANSKCHKLGIPPQKYINRS